jgi:hypothetical protein
MLCDAVIDHCGSTLWESVHFHATFNEVYCLRGPEHCFVQRIRSQKSLLKHLQSRIICNCFSCELSQVFGVLWIVGRKALRGRKRGSCSRKAGLMRVVLYRCYETGEETDALYSAADQLSERRCGDQYAPYEKVVHSNGHPELKA